MEHRYLECECNSSDHIMRLAYLPGDSDYLYVEVHLKHRSLLYRIIDAVKHIFGYRSKYGDFDEFLWDVETVKKFRDCCDTWLQDSKWLKEMYEDAK